MALVINFSAINGTSNNFSAINGINLGFHRVSCSWPSYFHHAETPARAERGTFQAWPIIYMPGSKPMQMCWKFIRWLFTDYSSRTNPAIEKLVSIILPHAAELAKGLEYNLGLSQMGFALRPTLQSHSLDIIFHSIVNSKRQMKR